MECSRSLVKVIHFDFHRLIRSRNTRSGPETVGFVDVRETNFAWLMNTWPRGAAR